MSYDFGLQIEELPASQLAAEALKRLDQLIAATEPHDPKWQLRLQVEEIKDIVRQLRQQAAFAHLSDPQQALAFLRAQLLGEGCSRQELAELTGLPERAVASGALSRSTHYSPARLTLVAKLTLIVEGGFSKRGTYQWFYRERYQLDDRRPVDLLDVPDGEEKLLALAYGGLTSDAS